MDGYAENIRLEGDKTVIIDQSRLPNELVFLELKTREDFYEAISELKVRGAPAIGICAAFGLYVVACSIRADSPGEFMRLLHKQKQYLEKARPTAVNLKWALDRMEGKALSAAVSSISELLSVLREEALAIQKEDIRMCRAISEYGLTLLKDGDGILTHCNAGPLATSCYGTALGPILLGTEQGMKFHVYADETRPLLQGARLTTYELSRAGVDVTLICDNMAGMVMKNGWVKACMVGCDRVAANGDTANKIGTSGVAVLASYYGIPFYVLGPTSTLDPTCPDGTAIPIECREPSEIREKFYREPMAPGNIKCYNPAFDITDHTLITGIVTEYGILRPPYTESIREVLKNLGKEL